METAIRRVSGLGLGVYGLGLGFLDLLVPSIEGLGFWGGLGLRL